METESRRELVHSVTAEFEDVDAYGVVHHTRWVAYLERARLRLLNLLEVNLFLPELMPVIHDLRVCFRRPARLGDELDIAVSVQDFDDYQITLGYRLRRGEEGLGWAKTRIAFAHATEGRLVPLPDEYEQALRAWTTGMPLQDEMAGSETE